MALELLSALSYVVIFRSVFCERMGWRLSYQIGMAEQAANSLLSASGAGGLAVGVWALRRLGMSRERIARRTVAFFLLTSMANFAGVIAFALLYLLGVLGHDPNPALTYSFAAAALIATVLVLALPVVLRHLPLQRSHAVRSRRVMTALRLLRYSVTEGVRDGLMLLRQRSLGVTAGSLGTTAFDVAVLGVCFRAFGGSPPIGVLVLGYLIGQLGGNLPIPADWAASKEDSLARSRSTTSRSSRPPLPSSSTTRSRSGCRRWSAAPLSSSYARRSLDSLTRSRSARRRSRRPNPLPSPSPAR